MKMLAEYNKVKAEYMGKLLFFRIGAFYVALGIDAYILHEILEMKKQSYAPFLSVKSDLTIHSYMKILYFTKIQKKIIDKIFINI